MLNHVPEEGEYIYNRYLIFISFIWIAVIFAAILFSELLLCKKRTKRNSVSFKYPTYYYFSITTVTHIWD